MATIYCTQRCSFQTDIPTILNETPKKKKNQKTHWTKILLKGAHFKSICSRPSANEWKRINRTKKSQNKKKRVRCYAYNGLAESSTQLGETLWKINKLRFTSKNFDMFSTREGTEMREVTLRQWKIWFGFPCVLWGGGGLLWFQEVRNKIFGTSRYVWSLFGTIWLGLGSGTCQSLCVTTTS